MRRRVEYTNRIAMSRDAATDEIGGNAPPIELNANGAGETT